MLNGFCNSPEYSLNRSCRRLPDRSMSLKPDSSRRLYQSFCSYLKAFFVNSSSLLFILVVYKLYYNKSIILLTTHFFYDIVNYRGKKWVNY